MNVKQLFQEVRHAQREIDVLRAQFERIDLWSKSSTSQIKPAVVQSSRGKSKVEEGAVNMMDVANHVTDIMNSIAYKQYYANLVIDAIPEERYRTTLRCYYINCNTWPVVAALMHYDPDYIKDLGKKAVQAAQEAQKHLTVSYHV